MSPTCSVDQRLPLLVPNADLPHHFFLTGAAVRQCGCKQDLDVVTAQ